MSEGYAQSSLLSTVTGRLIQPVLVILLDYPLQHLPAVLPGCSVMVFVTRGAHNQHVHLFRCSREGVSEVLPDSV
jgi:hypothetical protein